MDGKPVRRNAALKFFLATVLCAAALCSLSACASTGPRGGFDPGSFPRISHAGEDINGHFPAAVYIKTRTQSFNSYHYYLLSGGRIWYKSIDGEKEPKDWVLFEPVFKFEETGIPHGGKTNAVIEISADADELVALSAEGAFYRYCFDTTIAHRSHVWLDRQGWPKEEQLYLDERTAANRAWAIGKRNPQVLYYEDPFGNQHHNGTMEIVTTYMLLEDGQEIAYADTGLPSDFSRNFIGPERGAFKAAALSASASTMFVISEAGVMYTRMADFDISGSDPMFFKYTYVPYKSNLAGTDYFSNLTEWALPSEDWRRQPPVPLAGNAAITRRITILQNGQGNAARELRVAGRNADGEPGFWTKAVFDDTWEFKPASLYLSEDDFLRTAGENSDGERGNSPDKRYGGYWWTDGERENDFKYEIPNFNILEGSCDLRITYRNETCVLKLHPVEMWTYLKRDYLPGRNGPPKLFFVTLEIPANALKGLSEDFIRRINDKFAKNDRALFKYVMAASSRFITLWNWDETNAREQRSTLFLTGGTLSDYFPEFRRTWYIADYDELRRYASAELALNDAAISGGALNRKISLNKTFLAELQRRIAALQNDKFAALKLDMLYLPLHYIVRFSPLRLIDVPKIRTMTSYGEKIVLVNSDYTGIISDTRIWVIQKIIGLLETRIKCYEELAAQFSGGAESVSIPPWYAETPAGFWDIAGLPRRITGAFSSPGGEIPAALQLRAGGEGDELLGWYLSIGDNPGFTFFLDPRNSIKTIYSRRGKTPEQSKINGTLYVNPGRTSVLERRIIENSIKPLGRNEREGLDISITYDGNLFEMRRGGTLIFHGKLR